MRIVLLAHPAFMDSQSMPRFAGMLRSAYEARGHEVQVWAPPARLRAWLQRGALSKWAGYVDQYLLFAWWLRGAVAREPADTLFVLTDQAQGPWAPRLQDRPHVVHVHDLLALRSALGEIPQNPTRFTGRLYQRFIRHGYQHARHFICISQRTREDLLRLSRLQATTCEVVHNGMNHPYEPMTAEAATGILEAAGHPVPGPGMLLHVSGGSWYKNVQGVLRLYAQHVLRHSQPLPLWLVGVPQSPAIRQAVHALPPTAQVRFLYNLDNTALQAAYSLAQALLFPSLAEGFGWPIIEAQACGCPVITTDDAPMNEIGGPESRYLPLLNASDDIDAWAAHGAQVLQTLMDVPAGERRRRAAACVAWSRRFEASKAIDQYLRIYARLLSDTATPAAAMPTPERR